MANVLKKWVESDKRELKRLGKIADQVEAYANDMEALSDEELKAKTPEFKQRYQNGETLDDLLPEAFAVAREGAKRVLGLYPYRVQIIGGTVLHEGNIAEMRTGEGKTLTRPCRSTSMPYQVKGSTLLPLTNIFQVVMLLRWVNCITGSV